MIIVNLIIEVPGIFENKSHIKNYLYEYHKLFHCDLKEYNNRIAKKYGDEHFSMTFVKPNMVVITQRYIHKEDFEPTIKMRNELKEYLISNNIVTKFLISDPFEINYKK